MDRQQVFDDVTAHLLTQQAKALSPDGSRCCYRTESGLKCAIGCLIPDDVYSPAIEGCSAGAIADPNCTELVPQREAATKIQRRIGATPDDVNFLNKLQAIHDGSTPDAWEGILRHFAVRHDLSFNWPPA